MKSILVYGIAATCMAQAVMAGETQVSRTVVVSGNAGTPHLVFSTNITTRVVTSSSSNGASNTMTRTFSSSGGDGVANVQVKVFNAKGEDITPESVAGTERKVTWLGVTAEETDDVVRSQLPLESGVGLTIHGVIPDSPAAKAGLLKHDILIRLNDQLLMEPRQLSKLVQAKKPGDRVKLTFLRKGKEAKTEVTLEEHAETNSGNVQVLDLGDMGGTLNINAADLLKGIKLTDTNLSSVIEAALKAVEQPKADK
jgi:C-terminal processing protease CtpA/Prc